MTDAQLPLALVVVTVLAVPAAAQSPAPPQGTAASWSGSASAYAYFVPDDDNYLQPTLTLDREWVHIQARYNYEAQKTGSLWFGYNFEGGETVEWTLTPKFGAAFGDVAGVAPGYSGSLTWRKLEAYSEGEYLYDLSESADSFLYNWSEISLRLVESLRVGLATQRTRARESARVVTRGPLVGFTVENFELAAYVFFGGDSDPTFVTSVTWSFED